MLIDLFKNAGWVNRPLGVCAVLAIAIILYKLFTLWRIQVVEEDAFNRLVPALKNGDDRLLQDATLAEAPAVRILHSVAALRGASEDAAMTASEIALSQQRLRLRSFLGTLATIGSTAPFIGLLGTVIGVMDAFSAISKSGLDQNSIAGGIAEALSATALGLLVAIPSVMMYNFLLGRVQGLLLRIHGHIGLLTPLLHGMHSAPNTMAGSNGNGANGAAGYAARRSDVEVSPNGTGAITSAANVSTAQQEA